jgi:hypothetical protein
MGPTTLLVVLVVAIVAMCIASEFVGAVPTRTCPQCGHRVRLGVSRCRGCLYRFM